MTTTIRNINKKVFAELKAEAAKEGLSVGEALNMAIIDWVERRGMKKLSFLDYKPTKWGKGTERSSQDIDKVLYGD